jgi:hypothetical protein
MHEFYVTTLTLGIVLLIASVCAIFYAYRTKQKALDKVRLNPEKYSVVITDSEGDTLVISPLSSKEDIKKANNIISSVQSLSQGKFVLPPPTKNKTG